MPSRVAGQYLVGSNFCRQPATFDNPGVKMVFKIPIIVTYFLQDFALEWLQ